MLGGIYILYINRMDAEEVAGDEEITAVPV